MKNPPNLDEIEKLEPLNFDEMSALFNASEEDFNAHRTKLEVKLRPCLEWWKLGTSTNILRLFHNLAAEKKRVRELNALLPIVAQEGAREGVRTYYDAVMRRADETMRQTNVVTGAHYNAMKVEFEKGLVLASPSAVVEAAKKREARYEKTRSESNSAANRRESFEQ